MICFYFCVFSVTTMGTSFHFSLRWAL